MSAVEAFDYDKAFDYTLRLSRGERLLIGKDSDWNTSGEDEWVIAVGMGPKFKKTLSFNVVPVYRTVEE